MISTTRNRSLVGLAIIAALVALTATACGSSDSSSTTQAPGVDVTDPWIRATPASATAGAAYMMISSTDGDRLTGASVPTDVAAVAEMHETVEGESGMGQMSMRQVSGIDIPAGGSVDLEPGGFHIMLLELAGPLEEGQTVPITLTFEKAGTVIVDAPVRTS